MSLLSMLLVVALSADDAAVYRAASVEWKKFLPAGVEVRLARNTDATTPSLGSFIEMQLGRAGVVDAAAAKEIAHDVRERNRESIALDAKLVDVVTENANVIAGVPAYDASRRHALVPFRLTRTELMLVLLERSSTGWRVVWSSDYGDITNGVRTAPQSTPAPLRVGGDVKAPVLRKHVDPVYPAIAKKERIQGIVIAEVIVDETGHVTAVYILKPLPFGLDTAAEAAVRQWEVEPGTYVGKPVAVIYNLTVEFRLDEKPG